MGQGQKQDHDRRVAQTGGASRSEMGEKKWRGGKVSAVGEPRGTVEGKGGLISEITWRI